MNLRPPTAALFPWLTMAIIVPMPTVGVADVANIAVLDTSQPLATDQIKQTSRVLLASPRLSYHLRAAEVSPHLTYMPQRENLGPSNSCDQRSSALCYDYRLGHAIYKPMQHLLPVITGLTPENVTFHRHKVIVRYSFK